MRHFLIPGLFAASIIILLSFSVRHISLREIYSQPPAAWPAPLVEAGADWKELGTTPRSPVAERADSLRRVIELGKVLFFDPRLSASGKISCASCHQPELYWTDARPKSIGHNGAVNKRNSPSIENTWYYRTLFRDGRARDLEDQSFGPINSESEMHGDMRELPAQLRRIRGYLALFDSAFGDPGIDPGRIATAIATFERTIISGKSKFDGFLMGDRNALTDEELEGLHIFRTKAGCMNCHNGPLFTDNGFHTAVSAYYEEYRDNGRYLVTHRDADMGKFRTPSLRNVMKTGPWMHHGMDDNMSTIIEMYNQRTPLPSGAFMRPGLTGKEKRSLLAFLHALSSPAPGVKRPILPG